MRKVLLIAPMLEYPPKGGPFLRTLNAIKALNKISELHIVSRVTKTTLGGQQAEQHISKLCKSLAFCPSVVEGKQDFESIFSLFSKHQLTREVLKLLQKLIFVEIGMFFLRYFLEIQSAKVDAAFIVKYASTRQCNIVWFTYASISTQLINEVHVLNPNLKIVADTDSVWSRFIKRGVPYQKSWLRRQWLQYVSKIKEKEEMQFVSQADVVTAVSTFDAKYYQSFFSKKARIVLFSNTIDATSYKQISSQSQKKIIHFAGSFGVNSPTDQAIRWFISNVFPLVLKNQSCHLEIIGKGSKLALSDIDHPNISVLGEVKSMVPYLSRAMVVIVPLFFESGTRFKILEAGALKKAVVSTSLGAEGLEVKNGENIIIADTAKQFAKATTDVLGNSKLAHKLGNNLFKLITSRYGLDQQVREARTILKSL